MRRRVVEDGCGEKFHIHRLVTSARTSSHTAGAHSPIRFSHRAAAHLLEMVVVLFFFFLLLLLHLGSLEILSRARTDGLRMTLPSRGTNAAHRRLRLPPAPAADSARRGGLLELGGEKVPIAPSAAAAAARQDSLLGRPASRRAASSSAPARAYAHAHTHLLLTHLRLQPCIPYPCCCIPGITMPCCIMPCCIMPCCIMPCCIIICGCWGNAALPIICCCGIQHLPSSGARRAARPPPRTGSCSSPAPARRARPGSPSSKPGLADRTDSARRDSRWGTAAGAPVVPSQTSIRRPHCEGIRKRGWRDGCGRRGGGGRRRGGGEDGRRGEVAGAAGAAGAGAWGGQKPGRGHRQTSEEVVDGVAAGAAGTAGAAA